MRRVLLLTAFGSLRPGSPHSPLFVRCERSSVRAHKVESATLVTVNYVTRECYHNNRWLPCPGSLLIWKVLNTVQNQTPFSVVGRSFGGSLLLVLYTQFTIHSSTLLSHFPSFSLSLSSLFTPRRRRQTSPLC